MLKRGFNTIAGSAEDFSMGSRMFHIMSVFIGLTLLIKALFYQFTSLQLASAVCGIAFLLELGFYYMSRYRGQVLLAPVLSSAKLALMLIPIYLYNGGLSGNMLLLSALSLFLIILITPQKQGLIWLSLVTGIALLMMVLEYLDPSIVQQHYGSRQEHFIDLGITYVTITLILYGGITVLRKSYEQQKVITALQTKKLQSLNDEKDKLFSILSRELGGPLLAVKQYLSVMKTIDLTVEERSMLEKDLNRSLDDAQYLLHNVVLWAKTQMDVSHVQLEPVNLQDLIHKTVGLFQASATKKGITVQVDIPEDINVLADLTMLKVVMRNLISNAIKFTNLEGAIAVQAEVVDGEAVIRVKDNGIGLTKEKQAVIFSLNIAPNYGTANEKGTGLGLVLSKDYMDRQGGQIWFESIPWEGTAFYVSLPVVVVPDYLNPQ